ncbi:MAG: DUF4416 family protein [Candidatus Marinimicrobia bacterium]|nr:DUF4416 family protein [Candidatus Neomarinimicrobiota bacterium]
MGLIREAPKGLLFTAIMYSKKQTVVNSMSNLLDKLMAGDWEIIGPHPFSDITSYYEEEMGSDLVKIYAVNIKPISLENSAGFKLKSNLIESDYKIQNKRLFNIDPGMLTHFNFTLLTTKGYAHRIYLDNGIWSELTLFYQNNHYHPLPWTYQDYRNPIIISFLEEQRKGIVKGNVSS